MLALRHVTAGYGDTVVLRDVSLEVGDLAKVALLGPNGAGKTTLLKVASGLVKPASGQIVLDGEDVTGWSAPRRARRGLCHVPEGRGIFPTLTVRENLRLFSPRSDEPRALELAVEAFPVLGERLGQIAGSLSGGEQQMLAISRAYIANPRVVLVDEASLGLAPIVVDALFAFLARVDVALLLVEQYVNRALQLADTVFLINNGTIVAVAAARDLNASEIFERYLSIDVAAK
jgi:branched-chain amino acid transport system ATP-binding protein